MAAQVNAGVSGEAGSAGVGYPGSAYSNWVIIHGDLTAAAESATILLRPLTYGGANARPLQVGPGATRIILRTRYLQGSTITTAPVVRFYGVWGPAPTAAGVFDDDLNIPMRLDNADSNAAGLTIPLGATNTEDIRTTTYRYGDAYSLDALDMQGAPYLLALPETAAVVSAGSVQLMALLEN